MFEKIAISIKTFLRDEKLYNTINAIDKNMPLAQMIIADDGEFTEEKEVVYDGMQSYGHKIIRMPFDSGFGAKSNAIIKEIHRPYLLIASDDFDFSDEQSIQGIFRLQQVLERGHDIISGRVNHKAYEFNLEEFEPGKIREIPVKVPPTAVYWKADLTVNYSLVRRKVFEKVQWDDEVKIGGGEHGAFFYDVKKSGFSVGLATAANINEQKGPDSERYKEFRKRAFSPERPCFDKRGITEYVLGSGEIDYKRVV